LANPKTSFLSGALKTIGTIAKVCPIAQPVLGAVGAGLDVISNIGQESPWDSISHIPSIAAGFSSQNISESLNSYKKTVADVSAMDPSNPKQFFATVSSAAKSIGKSMDDFKSMQASSRAPQSKVEGILQQLKASDASLKDFTEQASTLTAKKAMLSAKIDSAMHEIGELTSQAGSLTERLDVLNRNLTKTQDLVDHPAIVAAKGHGAALARTTRLLPLFFDQSLRVLFGHSLRRQPSRSRNRRQSSRPDYEGP
jgi:hypothetical protein